MVLADIMEFSLITKIPIVLKVSRGGTSLASEFFQNPIALFFRFFLFFMWEIVIKNDSKKKNISGSYFDEMSRRKPVFQTLGILVRNENSMKSARTNFRSGEFYKEKSLV